MELLLLLCVLACGSERFGERERAADCLRWAGPLALPVLYWGCVHPDPEIRRHCWIGLRREGVTPFDDWWYPEDRYPKP